jgi:MFS family permease
VSLAADLRAVVRRRDFRRLYATRLISQTADGMVTVGLTSFVFFAPERQASAADAAAAFASVLLPYSLVGPFAGVLLDRWRRRNILVVASLVRALLITLVATIVATGYAGVGFYAAGLAVLSVNRFFLSALSAALPHVVPRDELVMANSISTTSGTVAALVGGVLGFGARNLFGEGNAATAGVLLAAATTCLAAALVATRMAPDLLGPDLDDEPVESRQAVRHVVAGMLDGARHVRSHRAAAYALGAITGHRFVYGISTISTILLYRNYFNASTETDTALAGLALAVTAAGAGFLLAAVLTPEATPRHMRPGTYVVATFVLAAVAEAFYVVGPMTEPSLVLGAFVLGFVAQGSKICVDAIVQTAVDDAYRGRVFSFYDVLFNVSFVSAAVAAILVVPPNGYSRALYGGLAIGYALTALAYGMACRRTPSVGALVPSGAARTAPS